MDTFTMLLMYGDIDKEKQRERVSDRERDRERDRV